MGMQQKNLSIVFRGIQPEMLYQSIRASQTWDSSKSKISTSKIDLEVFEGLAHTQYPAYSYEEIENIYRLMTEHMMPIAKYVTAAPSIFMLLVRIGKRVFRELGGELYCEFSQVLAWQNVYQKLGQDLFTTAYLAHEDLCYGRPGRTEFTWDAIIKTDNARLNVLLREGIAENHCHLGGTTQNFSLSWACVMNYPQTINLAAKQIKQNLQATYSRGATWNVWTWEERLLWASYLRIELTKRLENPLHPESCLDMEQICFCPMTYIKKELGYLKPCYAAKVSQYRGPDFVLDYALRHSDCKNGLLQNHNRLLSGERSFLYRCFRACFDGTFSENVQNWFYMYLLIKENFRAELVQVNHQPGFKNFKDYQDRKDNIYDGISGYHAEAIRLSVNANQQSQNIVSFELRVAPKATASAMCEQVRNIEQQIAYAGGQTIQCRHFYVYHFIKMPDIGEHPDQPRNRDIRLSSRRNAKALARALRNSNEFCCHIWGIDAANIEIGCRPETFATEFRYLKDLKPFPRREGLLDMSTRPHLHATYHAGEDFLDIVDGIRAIDEAIKFLHLSRGDRIGHALALGVEPSVHYGYKNRKVVLPKHDLLDNLIWMIFRAQELGVCADEQLSSVLHTKAHQYLSELYCQENGIGLYEFYCSMQLRGDDPELYRVLPYDENAYVLHDSFERYKTNDREELKVYRKSSVISHLCQRYHYDRDVRERGREVVEFSVDEKYMLYVRKIQDALAKEMMEKGIMIECNPTSNYLIGTFRRYDAHPIFRFNNTGLIKADGTVDPSAQLSVSINTDDLGVFDTSLENEYAILAASLQRMSDANGKRYLPDSIYAYLENVRRMGIEQSFLLSMGSLTRHKLKNCQT